MKTMKLSIAMLLALGLIGATPVLAQDDDGPPENVPPEDAMDVVDENATPDEVMNRIELPEDASDTAREASAFGLDTANDARERGRDFGQERADQARDQAREFGQDRAEQAREQAQEFGRDQAAEARERATEGARDRAVDERIQEARDTAAEASGGAAGGPPDNTPAP